MLLTQNSKLKKTSKITGVKTFDFALPAIRTCPFADDCKKFCYAKKGAYTWPAAKNKHDQNFKATKRDDFSLNMVTEIIERQIEAVRIHSSGDFYSIHYLLQWFEVMHALPHVTFYAYTKSIPLFKTTLRLLNKELPPNFTVIYSLGGKADAMIDLNKDRHARVFDTAIPSGYSYANDNDHIALARNKKIGLLKH